MCKTVLKAHILSGDDVLSKIGTKKAALLCEPVKYISSFADAELSEADLWLAEEYLVKVWSGIRSKTICRIFNQLTHYEYTSSKDAKPLESLPPTSSIIRGHLVRAHFVIRKVTYLNLSNESESNDDHSGWVWESGFLLPAMCLNEMPNDITVMCKCEGKCKTNGCACRNLKQSCTIFCHKKKSACENK